MPKAQKRFPFFPLCATMATLLIGGFSVFHLINEQNNRKAMLAFEAADLENAEAHIRKTTKRVPFLINQSIIDRACYKKTNHQSYLEDAENCLEKALSLNSHDNMIRYHIALVLQEQGKNAASLLILKDLASRFPEKSLYQLSVFDALYKSGQYEASFPSLLQSVKSSPNLLNSRYLNDLLSEDVTMKEWLHNELLRDISKETVSDPVILAKHGSLFLSLGFENEAKKCLEQALLLLPNLVYPYYYLSEIEANQKNNEQAMIYLKKFVFLSFGSIS
jgi:tetratricopeptide (TPR) repeat protein